MKLIPQPKELKLTNEILTIKKIININVSSEFQNEINLFILEI